MRHDADTDGGWTKAGRALSSFLLGWPSALWASHQARRRLRAYGPGAEWALRPRRSTDPR